jgi:AcrR family transcriptional regulator
VGTAGRRTQRERREATVARLLQATIDTIVELGYARASIKEICDRAGVSHGGLFRHFATREDLVVAAASEVAERLLLSARTRFTGVRIESRDDIETVLRFLRAEVRSPENAMLGELLMAARTDHQLAAKLLPFQVRYSLEIYRIASELFGITEDPDRRFESGLFGIVAFFEAENVGRAAFDDPDGEERRLQLAVEFVEMVLHP